MYKVKCVICGEIVEARLKNQTICGKDECRKARNKVTYAVTGSKNAVYSAIRDIRPDFCKQNQCRIIRNAIKECKTVEKTKEKADRRLREIMPLLWETQVDCLQCADPVFRGTLDLLDAAKPINGKGKRKRGRPKKIKPYEAIIIEGDEKE